MRGKVQIRKIGIQQKTERLANNARLGTKNRICGKMQLELERLRLKWETHCSGVGGGEVNQERGAHVVFGEQGFLTSLI